MVWMIIKTYNVLILGTKNSVRSIMAEALFNTMGDGVYKAFSAGSAPAGVVNRFTLEEIKNTSYAIHHLRSKSWYEYANATAPKMNFVITVCDDIAKETMPMWPGNPITAHWHLDDPTTFAGTFEEKKKAYRIVFEQIRNKIDLFTQLPLAHLNQNFLNIKMEEWNE